ncbi:MAG: hypothetical protein CME70_14215 [Halobacteriovorax sp.]|nr:hypothetical protein [Halobacteriovorax sp.]|tara:strand:- start:297355 stop:297906 length:552 start_codon:yes stop_codon:yes gene_type:complete
MKLFKIGMLAALLSTSAFAEVKFTCSYSDVYKVEKKGKVKTKYGKPVVKVSGELSETSGGKLSVKSAYLFGTKSKQKIKFYRHERENEANLKFAKFHNKTSEELAAKTWLPTYVRFSLPKKSLEGKEKSFPAYFAYYGAKENVNTIGSDDPQITEVEVTEEELAEFSKENEKSFEYKLWCKRK